MTCPNLGATFDDDAHSSPICHAANFLGPGRLVVTQLCSLRFSWEARFCPQESYNRVKEVQKYRRLFFSLCWFHAILLERKKPLDAC